MAYVVNTSTDTFSRDQNHSGGVAVSPSGVSVLYDLGSPPCGPTRTSSPLSAAHHWRLSNAMSRTSATHRPRPDIPVAEARGFLGAFR
jgi:hypothetical protein